MCTYQVWVDIIIPLISAFIGGFITMLGVIITIRSEKKKEAKNAIKAIKPWIFSLDYCNDNDIENANMICLSDGNPINHSVDAHILIKNTDNGIGIIEKMQTEKNTYYPTIGKLLEKDRVTKLNICFGSGENLRNMLLTITDIYGNKYLYEVFMETKHRYVWQIREISDKKLIDKNT